MPSRQARILTRLDEVRADDWQQLDHGDNPFVSLPVLRAFEDSASCCAATGWQPHHLAVFEHQRLVAFAPSYLKHHSHGEFVFDWAWADAYQRHGLEYYPKLLTAVPYSPVPGGRLLTQQGHPDRAGLRGALVDLALAEVAHHGLSSWHCNFLPGTHALEAASRQPLLLRRCDWQFHWHNQGYSAFEDFLARLRSKKRKNLRRDRRLVLESGIELQRLAGGQLTAEQLQFVVDCYRMTFYQHGNHPALTPEFFQALVREVPHSVLVVLASRNGTPVAMSFFLQGGGRLYGRYWGCMEEVPGLHFEAAYHQGIEHAIAHGLEVFEPGAQGEHKISRGFEPVATHSLHHVADPRFRRAIADYLQREYEWMQQYRERLEQRLPFPRQVEL